MKYIYSLALIFLLIFGCKTRNIDTVTAQKIPYNDSLAKELTEILLEGDVIDIDIENKNSGSALRALRKLSIDYYEIIE